MDKLALNYFGLVVSIIGTGLALFLTTLVALYLSILLSAWFWYVLGCCVLYMFAYHIYWFHKHIKVLRTEEREVELV